MAAPSHRALTWAVARDVNRTVGGGYASMELLRRSSERAGWLTPDEHALLVAVSRVTPGTNILAYCAALGWLRLGAAGAALALAASSLPGSFMVTTLSAALVRIDRYPIVQVLLAIAMIVASTLVLSTAWALLRPFVRSSRRAWTLWLLALVIGLAAAGATPVQVLLAAAAWGAVVPRAESP